MHAHHVIVHRPGAGDVPTQAFSFVIVCLRALLSLPLA